ncbi:MAG: DUF2177 family protein [Burkholderiales bacterium]
MTRWITAYFATLVAFCVLDFLWLGFVAKGFYQAQVGPLMLPRPNLLPAAILYALCSAGLLAFAIMPAPSLGRAALAGAFLGLVVYGVYDLTNLAVLKGWTVPVALVDMAWGTVVCAASSSVGYGAARLASGGG